MFRVSEKWRKLKSTQKKLRYINHSGKDSWAWYSVEKRRFISSYHFPLAESIFSPPRKLYSEFESVRRKKIVYICCTMNKCCWMESCFFCILILLTTCHERKHRQIERSQRIRIKLRTNEMPFMYAIDLLCCTFSRTFFLFTYVSERDGINGEKKMENFTSSIMRDFSM